MNKWDGGIMSVNMTQEFSVLLTLVLVIKMKYVGPESIMPHQLFSDCDSLVTFGYKWLYCNGL